MAFVMDYCVKVKQFDISVVQKIVFMARNGCHDYKISVCIA